MDSRWLTEPGKTDLGKTDPREPYRRLLHDLVGRDFPEPEARAHWREIDRTRRVLARALGRDVSEAVAALDYFTRAGSPARRELCLLERTTLEGLHDLVRTDPLTGALNRRGLDVHLEREVSRARRTNRPLAVLACDVDRFKEANDQHGHPWGDTILRRVARLLLGHCRATDAVARLGGDEFLVLLPATPIEGALAVADRIHQTARTADLLEGCPETSALVEPITISIGAASGIEGGRELVARADAALYRAKRAGRGRSAA